MKRVYSVEELIQFEEQRQAQMVAEGYMEQSDADEWLVGYKAEITEFWKDENVEMMMVLEIGELEDEEYGLMTNGNGSFWMVYMSCRCNDVAFVV